MQSIKLCSHVGADGILHLDIPSGIVSGDIEVEVIIKPITPSQREWMPGFFEEVIGGWASNSHYENNYHYHCHLCKVFS
jgi:hypothetical protein